MLSFIAEIMEDSRLINGFETPDIPVTHVILARTDMYLVLTEQPAIGNLLAKRRGLTEHK